MQRNDAVVNNVKYSRIFLHTELKRLFESAKFEVVWAIFGIVLAIGGLCVSKSYFPAEYYTSDKGWVYYSDGPYVIAFSFGLIAAMVGFVSGLLGMGALDCRGGVTAATIATLPHHRLAVIHFVSCILVAIIDFVGFIVFVMIPIAAWNSPGVFWFIIAPISWNLSVTFLAHGIFSIASCGFMCENWCCVVATVEQQRTEEKQDIAYA